MKRVTQKDERGYYLVGDGIYSDWGVPEKFRGDDVDRLAAYEDTGLEPEEVRSQKELFDYLVFDSTPSEDIERFKRLRELAEADREGRCVVLPFKPPKWVYMCNKRFPEPAQAYYASAVNVLSEMEKGCVFGDTPEEAEAALKARED